MVYGDWVPGCAHRKTENHVKPLLRNGAESMSDRVGETPFQASDQSSAFHQTELDGPHFRRARVVPASGFPSWTTPLASNFGTTRTVCGVIAFLAAGGLLCIAAAAIHSVLHGYFFTQGTIGGYMHHGLTPIVLSLSSSRFVCCLSAWCLVVVVVGAILASYYVAVRIWSLRGSGRALVLSCHFPVLDGQSQHSSQVAPRATKTHLQSLRSHIGTGNRESRGLRCRLRSHTASDREAPSAQVEACVGPVNAGETGSG
ncbi:transmembrane protein [Cystoisospora suis]|uniref:Transmembrane protein n=1 Tax=Cystoisospora suis TaxID=483139 RepID=A0A2C6KPE5_9APIC|nr:transmembrane protein [Cystoisospora suis]